jgi:hypothetical protein
MLQTPWAMASDRAIPLLGDTQQLNRVDMVFLGDGYTEEELLKYHDDVDSVFRHLFGESPLREYQPYFNVFRVDVVSRESGSDHPPSVFRDTALDTAYDGQGCLTGNGTKIFNAAMEAPAYDAIIVLVNDPQPGGCHPNLSAVAIVSMDRYGDGPSTAAHEFGHAFGLLADEHDVAGTFDPTSPPPEVNVTTATNRNSIKWKAWIDDSTPIPTIADSEPSSARCLSQPVGLYEGAKGFLFGIFRPTCTSKMRNIHHPWREVSTEQLIKRMYYFVRPIESWEPAALFQELSAQVEQRFSLQLLQPLASGPAESPITGPLSVTWTLKALSSGTTTVVLSGTQPAYTMKLSDVPSGDYELSSVVDDATPLVRRRDIPPELNQTLIWTLRVGNHAPAVAPISNQTAMEGQTLAFSVSAKDPDGDLATLGAIDLPPGATFSLRGDVDGDGAFTQADADLLTHAIFDPSGLTLAQREQADLTGDKAISAADLAALGQVLANCERWGYFQWTTSPIQAGRYSLTFMASDGALTDIEPITVAVEPFWGDLNDDSQVTVDELILAVNFALGNTAPSVAQLARLDSNGDGQVTVDEILVAVNNALHGPSGSRVQAAIDRSGDGIISRLELEQWMATLQNHPPVLKRLSSVPPITSGQLCVLYISATDPDKDALTFTSYVPPGARFLPLGDVSMTGGLSAMDASLILQYLNGMRQLSEQQRYLADVTRDGAISQEDANAILQINVGLLPLEAYLFLWSPDVSALGSASVTFRVADGTGGVDSMSVALSIQRLWGDLNDNGLVTVNEIIRATNFALGTVTPSAAELARIDRNSDSQVTVDEVMTAVNNALNGPGPAIVVGL